MRRQSKQSWLEGELDHAWTRLRFVKAQIADARYGRFDTKALWRQRKQVEIDIGFLTHWLTQPAE